MTSHKIPCDSIWLDIEYSDGKRYFQWDYQKFLDPKSMLDKLHQDGRHLVTIIDPHLKVDPDFFVYSDAL